MKNEFQLVARSGLARRTFAILATTLAVVVLGVLWFAAHWSAQYADDQVRRETAAATKQYGHAVFQRLELAALALMATPVPENEAWLIRDPRLSRFFERVDVIRNDERLQGMNGAQARIELRVPADTQSPVVELVRRDSDATVVARLSADYLWQADALGSNIELAVATVAGQTLFKHPSGANSSTRGADLAAHTSWQLFLRERFDAEAWSFRMAASASERDASVAWFRWLLLASLLPILAGMALLASVLIRHSHRPLERLIGATRELAGGRFDTRVEESGDADSRALIKAFNEMTERIARQWHAMKLLSRIDRSILGAPDLDGTVRLALSEGRAILRCDDVAVLFLSAEAPLRASLLCLGATSELNRAECEIPAELLDRLRAGDAMTFGANDRQWSCLTSCWLRDTGHSIHLTPILHESNVRGAVLTSRSGMGAVDPESIAKQQHLAERLAVALASYERNQALIRGAYFDELTLLANRRSFQEHLDAEVQRCADSREGFALLFLDLDRFKIVNDSTGHGAGDRLLRAVGERLKAKLPDDNFIARLGGDEFTVVIPGAVDPAEIAAYAERLLSALSEPIDLGEHAHVVSASIGIAIFPLDGRDSETLLRNADTAMYRAKRSGSTKYAFYRSEMSADVVEYVQIERDLRGSLANDELRIHYQPQLDLRTGRVVGAEALLRWRHPALGMLTPGRFLEIAEDTGLIVSIGEWVIDSVCRQYRHWKSAGIELDSISFNASMAQLAAPHLVSRVAAAMNTHHVPRNALEIEITESALARDIASIERVLSSLRSMGVRVAIDDFGVGYSSLSYLQTLPFDVLKIDRSFVSAAIPAHEGGSLCETIIAMAKALRKQVIAEGVETAAQAQFLRERGCYVAQGYYCAHPLTVEAFEDFFRTRNERVSQAG